MIARTRAGGAVLAGIAVLLTCSMAQNAAAAGPSPQALAAFNQYVAHAESQIRQEERAQDSFLGLQAFPAPNAADIEARLRRGEIVITSGGISPAEVPGGLIHHWIGIVFIPRATIADVFAVLQNYDQMARYYSPDVAASHLVKRHGDDFRISMRLREHKIITVMLDGLYDVTYGRLDPDHQFSVSRSMQMVEVSGDKGGDDPDHGFLWRTNAYWRCQQADDGTFVEFESISLSRNVPTGWGWMIEPFIREIPRESLLFTLRATRKAVLSSDVASQQQVQPLRHRP
ncbi:MAG: hypothetical protein ACRD4R_10005 [Candidatus Acidiferrales bacterium]